MITISGGECSNIHVIISEKSPLNNEYLQAVNQGYKFTYRDHIYQKNHKLYHFNEETSLFEEPGIIVQNTCVKPVIIPEEPTVPKEPCKTGFGELCRECDKYEPQYCGSCNDGYYYTFKDRTKCIKCPPDRECFKTYYQIDQPNDGNERIPKDR